MEIGGSLPHSQQSTTCPYPSQINPFLCPSHFWQAQLVSFLVGLRTYQHPGSETQHAHKFLTFGGKFFVLSSIRWTKNQSLQGIYSYTEKETLSTGMSNEMKRTRIWFKVSICVDVDEPTGSVTVPYILESNSHPNLIRTSFADFLNEKKKLVRGSNPQLLQKSRGGFRLHGKPSRRALSSDLSRSVA